MTTALITTGVHVIEAISYRDDLIECRCGEHIEDIRDGSAWVAHGGRLSRVDESLPDLPPATEYHKQDVLATVESEERPVYQDPVMAGWQRLFEAVEEVQP